MMTTNIKAVAKYLHDLVEYESKKGNILGKHAVDIIIHDRSLTINAASIEVRLKVYNNNGEDLLGESKCSIMVVEKVTVNPKTNDEFRRTCSLVVNDGSHDIVWNKMSRESAKQAAEYSLGYLVNHASMTREKHAMPNIKGYVMNRVNEFKDDVGTPDIFAPYETEEKDPAE